MGTSHHGRHVPTCTHCPPQAYLISTLGCWQRRQGWGVEPTLIASFTSPLLTNLRGQWSGSPTTDWPLDPSRGSANLPMPMRMFRHRHPYMTHNALARLPGEVLAGDPGRDLRSRGEAELAEDVLDVGFRGAL